MGTSNNPLHVKNGGIYIVDSWPSEHKIKPKFTIAMLKPWQYKTGRTFVVMLIKWYSFFNPLASKKDYHFVRITTSIWHFLLCQSFMYKVERDRKKGKKIIQAEYRIPANSFRTCMYCDQRSQYIRINSKMNSFRGNYSRKYGISNMPVVHYVQSDLSNVSPRNTYALCVKLWQHNFTIFIDEKCKL